MSEAEPGAGEEAVEQAGSVLHPSEPGLRQRGQLEIRTLMFRRRPVLPRVDLAAQRRLGWPTASTSARTGTAGAAQAAVKKRLSYHSLGWEPRDNSLTVTNVPCRDALRA